MTVSKTLTDEITSLIKIGEELTEKAKIDRSGLKDAEISKAASWVTRSGEMIKRLYPTDSQHLESYKACLAQYKFDIMHSNYYQHLSIMTGLLRGVHHELEKGLLSDIKQLLQADIFADFLEMAEHLLKENYKDASAVIIGSVLEDTLRKLADANGVATSKSGKYLTIDPLNVALAKAGVYNRLVQKQITSWADLRNKAAHGHYDDYDRNQVEMMLLFTQDFCFRYLS
jgi:hypothetical protein